MGDEPVFLFVNRNDRDSRSLLHWLRRKKGRIRYIHRLRTVDTSTLACGGVSRRLRSTPCLIKRGREPIYSLNAVKRELLIPAVAADTGEATVPMPRKESGRRSRHQRRKPAVAAGPTISGPIPAGCEPGLSLFSPDDVAATQATSALSSASSFGNGSRSRGGVRRGSSGFQVTSGNSRDKKIEALESDLERLIASRRSLNPGIKRY